MQLAKRILAAFLILLIVNLSLPPITFAEQDLTTHPLEVRTTPEEEISTIKEKKTSGWTWVILLGLVGGAAAVAASSSGGDSSSSSSGDTGEVNYTW
jgi:hypothetical protein